MTELQTSVFLWTAQSTLALGLGLGATVCWRRRAATAHAMLLLALGGVLVLPLMNWEVKQTGMGVFPGARVLAVNAQETLAAASLAPMIGAIEHGAPPGGDPSARALPSRDLSAAPTEIPAQTGASERWALPGVGMVILIGWGRLFSGRGAARLAWGLDAGMRLRSASVAVQDGPVATALRNAERKLGVRTRIGLRATARASCPMIFCWGSPCVLVPESPPHGVDWRGVMAHELAHLVRRDHLAGLVAEIVCCVLPWHPLAWVAWRAWRRLAERLRYLGGWDRPSSQAAYAESLVAFVAPHASLPLTPAIVSRRGVAARIAHVLASRHEGLLGRRTTAVVACLAVMAGVAVAALAQSGTPTISLPSPSTSPTTLATAIPHADPADPPSDATKGVNAQIEAFLQYWRENPTEASARKLWEHARALADTNDPRIIPAMIGVIDADSSYNTIYGVGYFGLAKITGVNHTAFHDGPWWRRWWAANKARFPEDVRTLAIPELPKSPAGLTHVPFPENLDTLDGQIAWLISAAAGPDARLQVLEIARVLGESGNPRAIPPMIGVIDADNSNDTIYGVGYFGLSKLTDVKYSPFHDGAWWRRWWETNKAKFSPDVRAVAIPDLPKTARGRTHTPFAPDLDTCDGLLRKLREDYAKPGFGEMQFADTGRQVAELNDARAIPVLIGVIDADNSHGAIYGLGYFGLWNLTSVTYSPFHDGAWWRRWWDKNKSKLPAEAQAVAIPGLPKTAFGSAYTPVPESFETLDGKFAWANEELKAGRKLDLARFAQVVGEEKDSRAIPLLIGLMEAVKSDRATYDIGYGGLSRLTGVKYDATHDAAWWRKWWEEHKGNFSADAGQTPVPDMRPEMDAAAAAEKKRAEAELEKEFAGFPCQDLRAGGDDRKRYFLIGPDQAKAAPEGGWKLLLILPGGDGSADFNPVCRRIQRQALPDEFVAAELVAPVWSQDKNRVVWPTSMSGKEGAAFTTEEFIRTVVDDAAKHLKIDRKHVLALGWSSSGPALYTESVQPNSPVTGWFIAMSVFRPNAMPDLANAKGRRYYLLHSPDDKLIRIDTNARVAEQRLKDAGATVTLTEYAGGHGWREDPFGHIRRGVDWLEKPVGADGASR